MVESEAKLDVPVDFELPDLSGVVPGATVEPLATLNMEATYYDTPDLRLLQRGITLRHRTGEAATGIWTLKLPRPPAGITVERTEVTWDGDGELPDDARWLTLGLVRFSPLRPVATLCSTRRRLLLVDGAGRHLAEVDDDEVSVRGGPADGRRFRQVEVERSADGTVDVVEKLAGHVATAGPFIPAGRSKLAEAFGIGELTLGPPLRPRRSSLADVVRATIRAGFERIVRHDYLIRLGGDHPDAEAVHQARVGTRRLRADLKTLAPALDPVWNGHVQADLKWLGGLLGEVRDTDVLGQQLRAAAGRLQAGGHGPSGPAAGEAFDELASRLADQGRAARAALAEAMGQRRYLELLSRLETAAERPPLLPISETADAVRLQATMAARLAMPALARHPWRRLRRSVRAAGRRPSDAELHQIRIKAKGVRYAAEAAVPVSGRPAARMGRAAAALQTILGDHHDAVAAEEWLRGQRNLSEPAAFLAGELAAEQQKRQAELRAQWRGVWDRLNRKKVRRWLG